MIPSFLPSSFLFLVFFTTTKVITTTPTANAFSPISTSTVTRRQSSPLLSTHHHHQQQQQQQWSSQKSTTILRAMTEEEEKELKKVQEESRLKVLGDRRKVIRGTLKNAESLRNYRINNGLVPELDENGKPIKADSKAALTLTAFVIAAGAVLLRVGGRAAFVSTLGLDFATENPELKENLDAVLTYASDLNPLTEGALFILAWTFVKVFCFDAGGIVLALSSGILFGGVIQGAIFSAAAATIGSSVAFALAKMKTPVREKALELLEEYPSLRGIEKTVANDGLKAVLTLRLAPILPIPLGMYNYVYGVTNVPFFDFAGGIFLGSLKPYLLDSYLGYFGKTVVDGTAASSTEDVILLVALGASVLIGVFASQLAGETWESVQEEVEAEKRAKKAAEGQAEDDDVVWKIMDIDLPKWVVGFQYALQDASKRMNDMIEVEYEAAVWNYTSPGSVFGVGGNEKSGVPRDLDPANFPDSPEIIKAYTGFDFGASTCDGLVLSPVLFQAFFKYADPLYDPSKEAKDDDEDDGVISVVKTSTNEDIAEDTATKMVSLGDSTVSATTPAKASIPSGYLTDDEIIEALKTLRTKAQERIEELDDQINQNK